MESGFQISGCAIENQGEIKKLEIELWNLKVKENNVSAYTGRFQELTLICTKFVADEAEKIDKQSNNKRKANESFRNNHGHQQQAPKRQNIARVYNMGTGEIKPYNGNFPKCTKCHFHHNGPCTQKCHKCNKVGHFARDCRSFGIANVANAHRNNVENRKGNGFFECGATGDFKRDCPKLKNKDGEKVNAPGWVYTVGNAEKGGNASRDPDSNVSILFDTGADRSFISTAFSSLIDIVPDTIIWGCTLNFLGHPFNIDLMPVELVQIPYGNEALNFHGNESNNGRESRLTVISCLKAQEYMAKGCQIFLAQISAKKEEDKLEGKQLKDVPVVRDYPEVFPKDLTGLPPVRPVEF
uniref:CCHC-type domain-containing protein n=1 Tax=Tanacetum cinerariifolium TaxID=118510 RepID=A0A699I2R6_TANCI|nr:hypothetical protein [Tanacetum cinerariifolium]